MLISASLSGVSVTTPLSERITGRLTSVCGAMGVSTKSSLKGSTIGPPADRLYPVDPVGVAQMIPSAVYRISSTPSTLTVNRKTPGSAFVSATSFSAFTGSPPRSPAESVMRLSNA